MAYNERKSAKNIQSENPGVAEMKHVGLITSYAAADCGVQSVEVWERRIVEVQACSESRLVHAAGDSDTPVGGREGGRRRRERLKGCLRGEGWTRRPIGLRTTM